MSTVRLRTGGRTVDITRPEKVLFPRDKITKLDLATFSVGVAPVMTTLIKNRPVSMERYPDGIDAMKLLPAAHPEVLPRLDRAREGREARWFG